MLYGLASKLVMVVDQGLLQCKELKRSETKCQAAAMLLCPRILFTEVAKF